MVREEEIRNLLRRRTLTRDEQRRILKYYEPQLRLAGPAPKELFLPAAVDHFMQEGSLCLELRLLGRYAFWITQDKERRLAPDLLDAVDVPDQAWGRSRNILAKTPFVTKGVSWRYAGDPDLDEEGEVKPGEEKTGVEQGPIKEKGARSEKWALGCGCLSVLALSAGVFYLAVLLFGQPPLDIVMPLAISAILFGLAAITIESIGPVLVYLSATPVIWLVTKSIWEDETALICTGSWLGFVSLFGISLLILRERDRARSAGAGILDRTVVKLMGWISGLDHRTTQTVYEKAYRAGRKPTYYGRLFRPADPGRWLAVLQYWLFYPMNDWRSTHGGINDHEADWETVQVFLPKDPGAEVKVAFSNHHTVTVRPLHGRRPLVFVGAGSHANYPIKTMTPLLRLVFNSLGRSPLKTLLALFIAVQSALARTGATALEYAEQGRLSASGRFEEMRRRARPEAEETEGEPELPGDQATLARWSQRLHKRAERGYGIRDRAPGNGEIIGPPGQSWHSEVIDDRTPWVRYKGRWGQSVFWHGESGIGGPMFEQNGEPRLSWHDPVRWAELHP